jgi:ribosomal protein L34
MDSCDNICRLRGMGGRKVGHRCRRCTGNGRAVVMDARGSMKCALRASDFSSLSDWRSFQTSALGVFTTDY